MQTKIIKLIPPELIGGKTYYADSDGNILNAKGRIIKPLLSPFSRKYTPKCHGAYPQVYIAGKKRNVHVLVCATFWGPRKPGQHCHHFDGNKFNNRPTNLIFLDPEEHHRFDRAMRAGKIFQRSLSDPTDWDFTHHCEI